MKKSIKIISTILFAFALLCGMTPKTTFAAESPAIVESYTEEDNIVLYVSGIEGEIQELSYQLGNTFCEVMEYKTIGQQDSPMYTLILWDNSVSVMKKYETDIKDVLLDVVANRAPGEKFSIATLEKDMTVLSDYTDDYATLKQSINGVEKDDKSVYIIENLYLCLEDLNNTGDCEFKRVILISDGSGKEGTGYTKTELEKLLEEHNFPIYTIGVGDNEEGLQYMFSLSRLTGAKAFHVDELEDSLEVSESMKTLYNTLQLKVKVPEELLDGSTKNSKLSVVTANGNFEVQYQVKLPFLSEIQNGAPTPEITVEPTATVTPEPTKAPVITTAPTNAPVEQNKSEKGLFGNGMVLLIGILFAVAIVVGVIVYMVQRRKRVPEKVESVRKPNINATDTVVLDTKETEVLQKQGETEILPGTYRGSRFQITAVNDTSIIYRCNVSTEKVKIGRKAGVCNLVLEDKAVSGEHCEVYMRNSKVYVRDLGSANGTFVDGRKIIGETEIQTGTIMKLGKTEYRVTIG